MNIKKCISTLFNDEPKHYGLRGDPYLWEEMCLESENVEFLQNEILMEEYFYQLFYRLTGHKITEGEDIFLSRYPHQGMSGGHVSPKWWFEEGIPLLIERYKKFSVDN